MAPSLIEAVRIAVMEADKTWGGVRFACLAHAAMEAVKAWRVPMVNAMESTVERMRVSVEGIDTTLLSSTPPDPASAARALEAVIAWGGSVKKLEEAEGLDAVLLLCAKALEISAKRSSGIAWECAEHKTFGPSYLKCAFCVPRLAALGQEKK